MSLRLGYVPYSDPVPALGPFAPIFDVAVNVEEEDSLSKCDAIVVWGGSDICTSFYDETPIRYSGPLKPSHRDTIEWHMIVEAHRVGIPMIGVCRGAQMMCAYAGGKLVQHCTNHQRGHMITCFDKKQFHVSSLHHQMMFPYDVPHELLAWSSMRISNDYEPNDREYCKRLEKEELKEPELVFFNGINAMAVQCHPEYHNSHDPFNQWFNQLIKDRMFK